jgi:hypothetical protein
VTANREPTGSPVTAVRRTSRGPSAGFAVIGVVGAVGAAVVLSLVAGPMPAPSPAPVAVVSSSPAFPSASPSAQSTSQPRPLPTVVGPATSTVIVLRGVADPAGELGALTGCSATNRVMTFPLTAGIKGADVDAVADSVGREAGWLFVPPGIQASSHVWLGSDVVELANGVGQHVAAVSTRGEVWLGGRAGATRWVPIATPEGRTAWTMANDSVAGRGACGPWTVPAEIAGQRSVTCAGAAVPACLAELAQALAGVPDLLAVGGDVVVSAGTCPAASAGCAGDAQSVAATPVGWPASASTPRLVQMGSPFGQATSADVGVLPPAVLMGLLARPSLPLSVGGERAQGNACADTLAGTLHGSPWDSRVAWVGNLSVRWPTGTAAWFMPDLAIAQSGGATGPVVRAGDLVEMRGNLDDSGFGFAACSIALVASAASGGVPSPQPVAPPVETPSGSPSGGVRP